MMGEGDYKVSFIHPDSDSDSTGMRIVRRRRRRVNRDYVFIGL